MQSRRRDVNPICPKHEVHRWHLRAAVTVGLLQQQQFLQPEQHDYPEHLTSTAFWSSQFLQWNDACGAFESLWYRAASLRATFANKKDAVPPVNAFRNACAVNIFLALSRFNALMEIFAQGIDYCRRVLHPLLGRFSNLMLCLFIVTRALSCTYFFTANAIERQTLIMKSNIMDMNKIRACQFPRFISTKLERRCPANRFDHNSGDVLRTDRADIHPLFTHFR